MARHTRCIPRALIVFAALVGGLLGSTTAGAMSQAPVRVHYDHAGLTTVDVRNGTLTYVWQTRKGGKLVHAQSLEAYDEHRVSRPLTPGQERWLAGWIQRRRVFGMRKRYPPADPRSYGSAFVSKLRVQFGARNHQVAWDGTSRAPGPNAAAIELVQWAAGIARAKAGAAKKG